MALVRRAHGRDGEVQLLGRTDHPDEVLAPGRSFGLQGAQPGIPGSVTLTEIRPHGKTILARFEEVSDRTTAERMTGAHLTLPLSELPELEEGEFFMHDLVGYEVVLVGGDLVGCVSRVYDAAKQTLLGVDGPDGEQLIPFTRRIIREVDSEARRLVADPPPGLLE